MLEIRFMETEDLEKVAAIEGSLFSKPWSVKGFQDSLNSQDTIYLTALVDGEVAGYCGLLRSFEEADITNVAVAETFQGKGIAFAMLKELLALGAEKGILNFTLEVRVSNAPAIHVYEKLGFVNEGIRKNFYDMPKEDAMIMWKRSSLA